MAGRKKRQTSNAKGQRRKKVVPKRSQKPSTSVLKTAVQLESATINSVQRRSERKTVSTSSAEVSSTYSSSERKRRYSISTDDEAFTTLSKRRASMLDSNDDLPFCDVPCHSILEEDEYSDGVDSEDSEDYENDCPLSDIDDLENKEFVRIESALNDETDVKHVPSQLTSKACRGVGSPQKVWNLLVRKDVVVRPPRLRLCFEIKPCMRAVLVDWMMEVCENEKQHRETFHLAVDYLDRFLAKNPNLELKNLQCIGTTALFIASKYEEIYPPKLDQIVEYSAGACDEEQVRHAEIIMLSSLSWNLTSITAIHWLNIYLQLLGKRETDTNVPKHYNEKPFTCPVYMREEYIYMARVIDVAILDLDVHNFSYREIAAAVLFLCYEPQAFVSEVTGFSNEALQPVIDWIEPCVKFCEKFRGMGDPLIPRESVPSDDWHNIQTHSQDYSGEDVYNDVREQRAQLMKEIENTKHKVVNHRQGPIRQRILET